LAERGRKRAVAAPNWNSGYWTTIASDPSRNRKENEMSILVLFAWRGQPDSLVAAYHREIADAPSVTVDQPQRTLHVFASSEDGAVVIDLWENEDGFRRMMDDLEFRRNVEAADWPSDPKVEIYQVRATMQ
jgi:hypothetical protein